MEIVAPLDTNFAVLVKAGEGQYIVQLKGKVHSLKNLLGVDEVIELEGQEAVDYIQSFVDKPALAVVR